MVCTKLHLFSPVTPTDTKPGIEIVEMNYSDRIPFYMQFFALENYVAKNSLK